MPLADRVTVPQILRCSQTCHHNYPTWLSSSSRSWASEQACLFADSQDSTAGAEALLGSGGGSEPVLGGCAAERMLVDRWHVLAREVLERLDHR